MKVFKASTQEETAKIFKENGIPYLILGFGASFSPYPETEENDVFDEAMALLRISHSIELRYKEERPKLVPMPGTEDPEWGFKHFMGE